MKAPPKKKQQQPGTESWGGGNEMMSSTWSCELRMAETSKGRGSANICTGIREWEREPPLLASEPDHLHSLFPVLRLHGRVGHGDLCGFPPTQLCPEAGRAAHHDRHLRSADRDHLLESLPAL